MTATSSRAEPSASTLPLLPLAELALAGVTLAGILGLRRVFVGTEWFAPLALQAVLAHGLAALLRRRGVSLLPAAVITAGVGILVITWLHAGDLTTFGLPGGGAIDALTTKVGDAMAAFPDVKAPTEALDGFLIATSVSVWVGAILADWAGFRVDASLEATLPSATLFMLGAVLGGDVDRILLTGLWVGTALAFVLFRRADRLGRTATWVGERRSLGPRSMVLLGAGLALAAVAIAALVGPRLPGARSEAIVSLTDIGDSGPGTRVTVSPLVDIRARLVDQADVEVFAVRSEVRDYWRLTSLDRFDGRIWSSNGSYGTASGNLDDGVPVAAERLEFEQTFSIGALSQIWLPAAYEPQAITSATPVRYDEVSGTLIVDTDIPTSDNTTYRVQSALPQFDPVALAGASSVVPDEIAETYLDLPADFPDSVRTLAREVTTGSASAYEAARRLQDFFRNEFTYDLDVGSGHSEQAIERFVFELRRGYCEQFAGSFAAMARSLGIPARVAVGFTPGVSDPVDPTLYRVRGENAHAWPEVFLGEYGWVKFEPTPGRGAPFAEQYTGVPEQQAQTGGDGTTATTTVSPPSTDAVTSPTTIGPDRPAGTPDDLAGGTGEVEPPATANPWPKRIGLLALGLVLAVALYLAVVTVALVVERSRRLRAAVEADAQVALAWDDSIRAIRRAGTTVRSSETPREVAARIGTRMPSLDGPLRTLANAVEGVTYAPRRPDTEVGTAALALSAEIEAATAATMTARERFQATYDPAEHPVPLSARGTAGQIERISSRRA